MNLLAWIPFVHPIDLPDAARLWMLLPLAACIALVYRATRSRDVDEMPWLTLKTFATIIVVMWGLAIGAYLLHEGVLYLL